jgi:hypothetical protein
MSVHKLIKFKGIDSWSRPVFKTVDKPEYFGSVTTLFDYNATEEDVLKRIHVSELEYFGDHFGCEPHGGINPNVKLEIV